MHQTKTLILVHLPCPLVEIVVNFLLPKVIADFEVAAAGCYELVEKGTCAKTLLLGAASVNDCRMIEFLLKKFDQEFFYGNHGKDLLETSSPVNWKLALASAARGGNVAAMEFLLLLWHAKPKA